MNKRLKEVRDYVEKYPNQFYMRHWKYCLVGLSARISPDADYDEDHGITMDGCHLSPQTYAANCMRLHSSALYISDQPQHIQKLYKSLDFIGYIDAIWDEYGMAPLEDEYE